MRKLFLAAVAIMICAVSYAQNETEPKTLEERVASLEKKSVDWNKINRYVSVSGYVIGGYDWNDAGTSTFKLKNVNLSYSLPQSLLKKTKIVSSARVYVNVDNVFTVFADKGYKGYDDIDIFGVGGYKSSANYIPLSRTYTLGINITF